jgi:glycosyltransferase involved in cell wall biosynthesis
MSSESLTDQVSKSAQRTDGHEQVSDDVSRILMIVENTFPRDPRVWNEATTLVAAGYKVTVISLRSKADKAYDKIAGIDVYRFRRITLFKKVPRQNSSWFAKATSALQALIGYGFEHSYFTVGSLLLSLYICAKVKLDVIHLHNPPDTLFIVAACFKLFGKKVVFDHHDLSPELYLSRYNKSDSKGAMVYQTLRILEKLSLKLADLVITTNESYREIDIRRGGIDPRKVFVVRNGPDVNRLKMTAPDSKLIEMQKTILVYIGVMGPQDGVDYLLRALRHLVYDLGRTNVYCVVIGNGDSVGDLKALAGELKIDEYLWFTGYVPDDDLIRYLSTADICVCPDPSSPLNDVSTWIKIMEYMALGKPIVTFDLKETRYSAQESALYARPNDTLEFARAIEVLMGDPALRRRMGSVGKGRIERELKWDVVKDRLLAAYGSLSR